MTSTRGYAGGYSDGLAFFPGSKAEGIVSFRFDAETGDFSDLRLEDRLLNPSWIHLHEKTLLAVSEGFQKDSALSLYHVDADGHLLLKDRIPLDGDAICHVGVWNNLAVVSSYTDGWIQLIRIEHGNQRLTPLTRHVYTGKGPHERQESPHAHQATFAPEVESWLVCDLGTDRVWVHDREFSSAPRSITFPAGCGPRHLCPDRRPGMWWVWCELEPRLFCLTVDSGQDFRWSEVNLSNVPNLGTFGAGSAIHLHPSQPWIGIASRADHSLLLLDVTNPEAPLPLSWLEKPGTTPRDFRFDPSGNWLLAAAQDDHTLKSFALDEEGRISPTPQHTLETGSPTCLAV